MNINTLKDLNNGKKKDNENNAYVGGEKSGLAVQKHPDITSDIIEKARQESSRNKDEKKENRNVPTIVIRMYKDGFKVSDSDEMRFYSEEKNKKFLKDLASGNVPEELREKYPQGLDVGIEDLRSKQVKTEKPKKIFFQGEGMKLSDNVKEKTVDVKEKTFDQINLNKDEKVYNLQLRFSDGTKKVLDVNPSTTIKEVVQVIKKLIKSNFKILTVYPAKDLTESSGNLEQLDLLDSTVNVKIF